MKNHPRTTRVMLLAIITMLLTACSRTTAGLDLLPAQITTIQVTYYGCAGQATWPLSPDQIAPWQEWALALTLKEQTYVNNVNGGDAYQFDINDEVTFVYINAADYYVLCNDRSYLVTNPSDPPVGDIPALHNSPPQPATEPNAITDCQADPA